MVNRIAVLLGILVLVGCQSAREEEPLVDKVASPEAKMKALVGAAPATSEPLPPNPIASNRQIIRNAQVRFQVESVKASSPRINELVRKFGGMITASEETRVTGSLQYNLTVRVPISRLDAFLDALLRESIYTDAKTITADDVTKQYVDTEARIRSKKATEAKYLQLLKQAKNVAEVIEVENQLRQMREEIEVQESELRELKANVAMSTVNATLYEPIDRANAPEAPFYTQIGRNLRDGFGMVGEFLLGIVYFIPLLLLVGVPIWLLVRWWRKRKRTNN